MNSGRKNVGIYIHVPFCRSKCPYCDFYSIPADGGLREQYANALRARIKEWGKENIKGDTLYIGGGTPTELGTDRLCRIIGTAAKVFGIDREKAEITIECNPGKDLKEDFYKLKQAGVNRLSIGVQSAVETELTLLSRNAGREDAAQAVSDAREMGFQNISLDLMIGIPGQTEESLRESAEFCAGLGAEHISAYILKVEEGTPFAARRDITDNLDEDVIANLYLKACEFLERYGYRQYEISNFAKEGYESRHNLKYWNCDEYLGIGPSAHSFLRGPRQIEDLLGYTLTGQSNEESHGGRFYYKRELQSFINGELPVYDGPGGDFYEYAMLRLRLTQGLCQKDTERRFGHGLPKDMINRAQRFIENGYMDYDGECLRFTREGFLISNYILSDILQFPDY